MLQWLLADPARHQDKQFWLLFGNRTEKDIYYHEEFWAWPPSTRTFTICRR